ncbi:MAG: hypothetical protein EON98_00270 [Chitinophagaceae bacterium]|nr:MAG: hypothetical protein EON98_00270 [Chitinophagaceae bacterium]
MNLYPSLNDFDIRELAPDKWIYPSNIEKDEEKTRYQLTMTTFGHLLSEHWNDLRYKVIRDEGKAEALIKLAYDRMAAACYRLISEKKFNSDIDKAWIYVIHYLKLIQANYDVNYSFRPNPYNDSTFPPNDEETIHLWENSYNNWKLEFEIYCKFLYRDFTSPDFRAIVERKSKQNQDALNDFLYNRPPRRRNSCSDGEADFWRSVNDGTLDSIGF